jgi:wyosine [tRNA(Phe)-imidazoG37] synthetase (radical SAM superfamily)
MTKPLDTRQHDRDVAGMTYVYPVVSRRSQGVSVGVNLNVNNACNWRCIYCQVPNLKRGGPPPVDLVRLEAELRQMLTEILHGDFMIRSVPEGMRRLNDIAISGNGEPTTCPEFREVVGLIGRILDQFELRGRTKVVLITNGSQTNKARVQEGLNALKDIGGEVWFKLDSATAEGLNRINQTEATPEQVFGRLKTCASLCPTWIQTCVFALDGQPPDGTEIEAYLAFLENAVGSGVALEGVMLYGLARVSTQPEAPRLSALPAEWLNGLASRVEAAVPTVRCHP